MGVGPAAHFFATYPLKIVIAVLGVALVLFDYPLTLRGMSVQERWQLVRDNPGPVLGFGAVFAALFWIPFASIVLLPAGAAAAAELCCRASGVLRKTRPGQPVRRMRWGFRRTGLPPRAEGLFAAARGIS